MYRISVTIFMLLALVAPVIADAATRYVSQTATNGYAVGNNANDGLSKGAPKLNIENTYIAAATGDTIVLNDGTYTSASYFNNEGYNKGLTINCETDYACVLKATSGNHVWWLLPGAGLTSTFGKVVFDAQNTQLRCLTIDNDVAISSVVLNGTACLNPLDAAVVNVRTNLNITMTDVVFNASGLTCTLKCGGIYYASDHRSGAVVINGVTGTVVNTSAMNRLFTYVNPFSSPTALSVDVSNMKTTLIHTPTNTGTGWYAGQITNIDDPKFYDNEITFIGTKDAVGIQIKSTDAAMTAHRGVIRNNRFLMIGPTSGYCGILGDDVTTAGDFLANDGVIVGNRCTWTAFPANQTPHSWVLGLVNDGLILGNYSDNAFVCAIGGRSVRGIISGNICLNSYGQNLYGKGANATVFRNNVVIQTRSHAGAACMDLHAHADGTNAADVVFEDNLCYSVDDTVGTWVIATASQTGTWNRNIYYTNQSLLTAQWSYQGTTDNTLAGWNARAQVGTDIQVSPFRDGGVMDYRLAALLYSGCHDYQGQNCFRPAASFLQPAAGPKY